jgi:hypothetical protein
MHSTSGILFCYDTGRVGDRGSRRREPALVFKASVQKAFCDLLDALFFNEVAVSWQTHHNKGLSVKWRILAVVGAGARSAPSTVLVNINT